MRFQVPQFTDIEDKIIGPLTFKQFIYLAGGAGVVAALYALLSMFLPTFIIIIIVAPVAVLALALAFFKVNNRPFIHILEAFFKYVTSRRLYIWKHETNISEYFTVGRTGETEYTPKMSKSKLSDLSWKLDIKEDPAHDKPVEGE